jgi:hypothetical protein
MFQRPACVTGNGASVVVWSELRSLPMVMIKSSAPLASDSGLRYGAIRLAEAGEEIVFRQRRID